ncbi:MAG TPA: histidinol-phosphate transaminase [Planctomycetota bacterium]|nr:histidinol-phosphate transaminase [Planctomycetota bacterium]
MKPTNLIRPLVEGLQAYIPGEQPRISGLIKLNTNENAYPPSPQVIRAVKAAVDGRLRLYPNPTAQRLREGLAKLHRCRPENVIVGNGSDELLAMAVRAFVEPEAAGARGRCQGFTPSYSLYPVLARQHGASWSSVPLDPDFALPPASTLARTRGWMPRAALTFVTTPNAPSGRGYATSELAALCRALSGVVILDEAYVDFAAEHAMALALERPNVLVSRTFSKGYSLCFQRVGYFVGPRDLIAALDKIRDSYNVNGLGQVGALATLNDLAYYRRNFRRVIETRRRLGADLAALGFRVQPSQTNFLFARPPRFPAKAWLAKLRARKILVRWFDAPGIRDYLRITVGTDAEARAVVRAASDILS